MNELTQGYTFWKRVITLLEQQQLSQSDLSRHTGISTGSISSAITRGNIPRSDTGLKIAKALHTTLEYLLTGEQTTEDPELEEAIGYVRTSRRASEIVKALPSLTLEQASIIEANIHVWQTLNQT